MTFFLSRSRCSFAIYFYSSINFHDRKILWTASTFWKRQLQARIEASSFLGVVSSWNWPGCHAREFCLNLLWFPAQYVVSLFSRIHLRRRTTTKSQKTTPTAQTLRFYGIPLPLPQYKLACSVCFEPFSKARDQTSCNGKVGVLSTKRQRGHSREVSLRNWVTSARGRTHVLRRSNNGFF